jgi:hypothetical protein
VAEEAVKEEGVKRFEIKIDERSTSPETMVSIGGKRVGLVQKIVVECDANEVIAKAKIYVVLPRMEAVLPQDQVEVFETIRVNQLGSDVPALFREAGITVKDFETVVKERDEALAKIKSMEDED